MSFQAMTWAAEQKLPSKEKLVLLMLANCHNADSGRCDPSHKKLAERCGLSVATVKRAIGELEKKKILIIKNRKIEDVFLSNYYILNFEVVCSQGADGRVTVTIGSVHSEPRVGSDRPEGWVHSELQNRNIKQEYKHNTLVDNENIDRPDEDFAEEKIPIPDQPKKLKPKIPYQAIVDIYHEVLPELSEVLVLNEKRKRYLSARWQENKVHQTLDFWKDYFAYVRKSQFLMGNSVSTNGNKPFKADFEWLINPNNFVKVIEGKYVRNI